MMNKYKLSSFLLVCVFLLGSCFSSVCNTISTASASSASDSLPFFRKTSAEKDKILFYDFQWLEELSVIKAQFDLDFGADSYEIEEDFYAIVDSPVAETKDIGLTYRSFTFYGKNREPLMWSIAGCELDHLQLNCVSGDNGENWCLVEGIYYFYQPSSETKDALTAKLKNLYDLKAEGNPEKSYHAMFSDENDNTADLLFSYKSSGRMMTISLQIVYSCNDIIKTIRSKLYGYNTEH